MRLANSVAKGRDYAGLPLALVPHPIVGLTEAQIGERARAIVDRVVEIVSTTPALNSATAQTASEFVTLPYAASDEDGLFDEFLARGWSDGLPVILPTPERVERMLGKHAGNADQVVGSIAPASNRATLRTVAANCVMAGCAPVHFPIVLAAVKAIQAPEFNLLGMQNTTHPCAALVIVNGPIRAAAGINSGHNCFGNGARANAAIGRALRLVMQNVGGARPGEMDKSTQGSPAKFSFCIGENEEASPWPPLHVERGYRPEQSSVTVVAAEPPHNVNDHSSTTAAGLFATTVSTMLPIGANDPYIGIGRSTPVLVLGPEHARTIANSGYDKAAIKRHQFEHVRNPIELLRQGGMYKIRDWPAGFVEQHGDMLPIVEKPEDFIIAVAGGDGLHSAYIPTFAISTGVTALIEE